MKINRQEIFQAAGYVGLALLVVGYFRYSFEVELGKLTLALLIAGAVLMVAALVFNFRAIRDFFRGRSARLGVNTAVMTVAVVGIFGLLNFLGYRHHKRFDVTAEQLYSLSDQTRKIVSGLQKDVQVLKFDTSFDKPEDRLLRGRLQEYRDLSRHLSYEFIDPQARPDLAKQYSIRSTSDLGTLVISGDRKERVTGSDEQALTNAILKVTRETLKAVCFIEGHGEKSLSSAEGEGYAAVERILKNENYEPKSITLATARQVPTDCAVTVSAGPKQPFLGHEATMLGNFLDQGGKVMLLLDPETDPQLNDLLKPWNISLGQDTIFDLNAQPPIFAIAMDYGSHAITKNFGRSLSLFPFARSVKVADASKSDVSATEFLKTMEGSWAETELKGNEMPPFTPGKDLKGPVPFGVAVGKRAGDKEGRLVVIGDSDFAANGYIAQGRNRDVFMNSVNWLAQDEDLIAIRPKPTTDRRVTLTAVGEKLVFWLPILVMPLAAIGSGAYVWWKRR